MVAAAAQTLPILDENGEISSLLDKRANRQLASLPLNHITLYEDVPMEYDAWDIAAYYRQKPYALGKADRIRLLENGPVRAVVEVKRSFSLSALTQRYVLYAGLDRIDIETEVDWQETQHLLKTAFPFALHATHATFDIQFGNVQRPTHQNTSWDKARFEVCAHKWADVSENGYGVALLNNCKYGHAANGATLELTLLKSSIDPNPVADKGQHQFTYSIYPHQNRWSDGKVNQAAYSLNRPPFPVFPSQENAVAPVSPSIFSSFSSGSCIVDTIKPAEDGNGIILRLFESEGKQSSFAFRFAKTPTAIFTCDLLENNQSPLSVSNDSPLTGTASPYEIQTYRIVF